MAIAPPTNKVALMVADPCPEDDVTFTPTSLVGKLVGLPGKPTVEGVPLLAPGGNIEAVTGEALQFEIDENCIIVKTCELYPNLGKGGVGGSYAYTLTLASSAGGSVSCNLTFQIDADNPPDVGADGCIAYIDVAIGSNGGPVPGGGQFDAAVKAVVDGCIAELTGDKEGALIHPPEWAGVIDVQGSALAGSINTATGSVGPLRTLRLTNPGPCEAVMTAHIDWGQYYAPVDADNRLFIDGIYSVGVNAPAPAPATVGSFEGWRRWEDEDGQRTGLSGMRSIGDRRLGFTVPAGQFIEIAWQARTRAGYIGAGPFDANVYHVHGLIEGRSNGQ